MSVREDRILHADGSLGLFGVVDKADFALIIPRDGEGFWLVEQYRYAVQRRAWEFPQGSWEGRPDVDPAELARGELSEETGLRAASLEHLGYLHQSYGSSSQGFHVWLATGLTKGDPHREPEEEGMVEARFTRREFETMMRDGRIRDASSLAAWALLAGRSV